MTKSNASHSEPFLSAITRLLRRIFLARLSVEQDATTPRPQAVEGVYSPIYMQDVTQALRDAENALRDFIAATLERTQGREWLDSCGGTSDRIAIWTERKSVEQRRQEAGVVDERLLYYADFFDLKTILKKHWSGDFSDALGEWKRFEAFFDELARLRDPDAHRRELLPHQQSLVVGISGDIRSRLVRWRSRRERVDDVFPRIESVRDSLGSMWTPATGSVIFRTEKTLRPGDQIDFVVTARDPEDLPLEYRLVLELFAVRFPDPQWQRSNLFSLTITDVHIGNLHPELQIRSTREYHRNAAGGYDETVTFTYVVLPRRP